MAHNHLPKRERSKRLPQKKLNDDFIYDHHSNNTNMNCANNGTKLTCKGCENVFMDRRVLLHHQAKCMTLKVDLSKQGSFFGDHYCSKNNRDQSEAVGEKVLPASQPLHNTEEQEKKSYAAAATPSQPKTLPKTPPNNIGDIKNTVKVKVTKQEPKEILPNLPEYTSVPIIPNTQYNGIEGTDFAELITKIYEDTVRWKKNLFFIPSGKWGKEYIKLYSSWISHFNKGTTFQGIALKVAMILPNLLLQKPSATSKSREHIQSLEQRIGMWNNGKIQELWTDGLVIQKKLTQKPQKTPEDITRTFTKLMFEGKPGAAMKFLDENSANTVLKPTAEVINKLRSLHPDAAEIQPNSLYEGPLELVSSAHFNNITEQTILKAATHTQGSGGPSLFDAKQWKRMICSNQFKTEAKDLREELATFAKKIATETLDPNILEAYCANRLIPLDKAPGEEELQIRPIGVSEVMRRIVGKAIAWNLGMDIQIAAGPLQVSTGLKGGAEAAIHSMREIFNEEGCDGVILVDAENAFNRLNRLVALHNMQYICPPFATVLINTYRIPTRLFISSGGEIKSAEGTTQGDTLAMPFYGLGTRPILVQLKIIFITISQVWLADDAAGAGRLEQLKLWWDEIKKEGLKYGYHVKPSKSWLVLKSPEKLEECQKLFENSPINITVEGKRHLGATIGTTGFKEEYINEKVRKWTSNIESLAEIAKSQPHAAYSAYIHAEQHKYTYFKRTLTEISENLKPIDDAIAITAIHTLPSLSFLIVTFTILTNIIKCKTHIDAQTLLTSLSGSLGFHPSSILSYFLHHV